MRTTSSDDSRREPSEVLYRGCMGTAGAAITIVFAVLALWTLWQLIAVGFSALNLVLAAFFAVLSVGGLFMLRTGFRKQSAPKLDGSLLGGSRQRGVLRVAKKLDGRVTLGELTLHTRLEVADAREILEQFELHGVAEMQISDSGREVYVFPAFADGGEDKLTARSPLDAADREVELLFEELAAEEAAAERDEEVHVAASPAGNTQHPPSED